MHGPLSFANLTHLDALYEQYRRDPTSVEPTIAAFFQGFELSKGEAAEISQELSTYKLIDTYRRYGHLAVQCNPVTLTPNKRPAYLDHTFSSEELSSSVTGLREQKTTLQELIQGLESTYCHKIGFEYMHIENPEIRKTIQDLVETHPPAPDKLTILENLTKAELFEVFLHTKFTGQKRFSLEGCETLIPVLCHLLDTAREQGVQEAIIGMAHRGRLNVLANVLGKSYAHIFHEFEDLPVVQGETSGDVKYHKGFVGAYNHLPVTLTANPSHLESVDAVAEGIARAKQERLQKRKSVLPLLIHGDASIAGQGIVYETLQLSQLAGYKTGGTIHLIVNNHIGFTTQDAEERSTTYCSDIGKAFDLPIFHVNAEDPVSCIQAASIAMELRDRFQIDVIIDINGYRKYGHNEGDEPTFTQPLEYALIKSKPSILELFCQQLTQEGVLSEGECAKRGQAFKEKLHAYSQEKPQERSPHKEVPLPKIPEAVDTKVTKEKCVELVQALARLPSDRKFHPKVVKAIQEREKQLENTINWGLAEHLALASLLDQKVNIRLSGQDVGRGTFSHRHARLSDQTTGEHYIPLNHMSDTQGKIQVHNSPLSEFAVLGFEFGYSVASPETLVIWEAQFGDFANSAQVAIDQYISSSEQKWGVSSSLTLLLPHGYEGQGPEHSSARVERYLQLAAQENMRIVIPSTPAQLFHILREQALQRPYKPLIVFTPKALLRHPACLSCLTDLTERQFQEVIADEEEEAERLLLCTGKVYYDLIAEKEKRQASHVAIARVEQLYPFPQKEIDALIKAHKKIFWVQEEPQNMGAWSYVMPLVGSKKTLRYVGRAASASPAVGSARVHKQELTQLLNKAFE